MRRGALLAAAALVAVAALPFVASAFRPRDGERCRRDGIVLGELLRVTVVTDTGTSLTFCSVRCAEDWLARTADPAVRLLVLDEPTGEPLDAAEAHFVKSTILTSRESGERIHAFRRAEDARAHIETYGGRLLEGAERPLRSARGA